MKEVITYFVIILAVFTLVALASPALAQPVGGDNGGSGGVSLPNPLENDSIMGVLNSIIDALRVIAAPIVALAVLWGAFQMLFAGGSEEKFSQGKKTILYAIVGYVIILLADLIASLIQNVLGG